jgi:hypothetical protein
MVTSLGCKNMHQQLPQHGTGLSAAAVGHCSELAHMQHGLKLNVLHCAVKHRQQYCQLLYLALRGMPSSVWPKPKRSSSVLAFLMLTRHLHPALVLLVSHLCKASSCSPGCCCSAVKLQSLHCCEATATGPLRGGG